MRQRSSTYNGSQPKGLPYSTNYYHKRTSNSILDTINTGSIKFYTSKNGWLLLSHL